MRDHVTVTSQAATSARAGSAHVAGRSAIAADRSTFAPGLQLLPAPLREDVRRLYNVLRTLDDLVDEDDPRATHAVQAVESWSRDGRVDTGEARALEELARRHPLPRHALLHFCEGMRHDIAHASIETEDDFARYCQQAGGSVGIMLANLLGAAGGERARSEVEAKMAALGRAMQVTNILRDIDEDLSHGRLYIAATTIERFGFPAPGARKALLREQIAHADALYEEGIGAIPLLRDGRKAMALSSALYRQILRQIERDGFGRRLGRVAVPAWRTRLLISKHRFLSA